MQVLVLCGAYEEKFESEVMAVAKGMVDFAANVFQNRIISGLRQQSKRLTVLSAPFIGPFPNSGKVIRFKGFSRSGEYRYVAFNNLWGYRNLSRARAMKKEITTFVSEKLERKLIIVYSAHQPFLSAAVYAKEKDPNIRICCIVPDLPIYMNLQSKKNWVYDTAKKWDIKRIENEMKEVDFFVLLTEQMKEKLPVEKKPYVVLEGITAGACERQSISKRIAKAIVYTGSLAEKYGIRQLIDAFLELAGSEENYRLEICGRGECEDYVRAASQTDSRIIFHGLVSPNEAERIRSRAAVLVNPRNNEEMYTKYSFPSKISEYLMTGIPTVAYLLDGMPREYENFIYVIDPKLDSKHGIVDALRRAITASEEEQNRKYSAYMEYVKEKLTPEAYARKILSFCDNEDLEWGIE